MTPRVESPGSPPRAERGLPPSKGACIFFLELDHTNMEQQLSSNNSRYHGGLRCAKWSACDGPERRRACGACSAVAVAGARSPLQALGALHFGAQSWTLRCGRNLSVAGLAGKAANRDRNSTRLLSVDQTGLKGLARVRRWRKMLEFEEEEIRVTTGNGGEVSGKCPHFVRRLLPPHY